MATGTTGDFTADEAKPWAKETGITKIEVAAGVTTVGKYLFSGMNTVTDVSINNGVETISEYAFYDLPALKSVALPSSVSSVGEYAFALSAESTEAVWRSAWPTQMQPLPRPRLITEMQRWISPRPTAVAAKATTAPIEIMWSTSWMRTER